MKFNGQNVITDSDIVMTGQQAGHNLSEIINQHETDISNLKGNIKWIYKYGGVGSGSGGNGGSLSSAPWNFKVEIDEVVRENGTKVNLGQQREYKLAIQLYKVQGRTFTIKYTYDTPQGISVTEKVISPTQSALITDYINLLINGTFALSISDDEGNYDQFTMDYIVTAYSFKLDYVYADDKSEYIPTNNNIFVSAVANRGLLARFTSIVSVDVKEYYIEYKDWNLETHTYKLDVNEKYFYFDLGKDLNNDNSGNYQAIVTPHITLLGKNEEESIEDLFVLSDNLIPDNIYLKVEVDGAIYKNTNVTDLYQFYAGTIPFFVTGFQGFLDNTKPYTIQVYVNGVKYEEEGFITELQDLKQYELKIQTDLLEWNSIRFVLTRKEEIFDETYYFYTKSPLGTFVWYPSQTINGLTSNIYPIISYLYKASIAIHDKALPIPNTNKSIISMTQSLNNKIYQVPLSLNDYKSKDCLLSIGIKYNKLNDIKKPIILLQGDNSSNDIIIYQNKISIMGTEYDNFYLPIDDLFHLIDIYRRAVSSNNNAPLFEFVIYIDGIIECALPGFTTMQETYTTITLYNGLYQINYLEISYFNHEPKTAISTDLLELYNPNPNYNTLDFLTDSSILYHYYSYKLTFYPESISSEFKEAYSYVSLFYNNSKTGRIEVTKTLIQSIATSSEVPVLLIKYTQPRDSTVSNWTSDGSAFMEWMERSIDITKDPTATEIGYNVDIEYSKGKLELIPIDIKSKFPNAFFTLFLQGTSTLIYGSKNFDLEVNSPEEDYTYLYSPNFKDNDYNSFLPETRFTIKADVIDSSHSNNNAIGKFINTISTRFEEAKQSNNKYNPYLKNTLEGFPILLFLQNSYYENNTVNTTKDDYYFLGISNFNLGRDSEFNLGYKDLRLLPETIENGFAVTRINNDVKIDNTTLSSKEYLSNLGVMEVRENRNYFDFSQSHNSILFSVSEDDNDYMFSKFKANNKDILKTLILRMVLGISKGGGFIFDQLGKNMINKSEYDKLGYGYDEGYKTDIPQNIVPNYKVELKRSFINAESVLEPTGKTITGEQNDLIRVLLGDETIGEDPLIDYKSLSEYYVICMALGLLDSVLKNMNFRKWKNKFYLAFYDMDTSLGKDNAGNNSDYICFSDYWKPDKNILGGSTILEPAISYKDWYDKNIKGGYDVPSSYLFALAKYGYHVLRNPELRDWYPQNIWARFRRNSTNISGWSKPEYINNNHIGCLKNADQFIDNYFSKHLENVPDVIFNLNYRTKYLRVEKGNKTSYSTDYNKFSGRRLHYVKDWLNSRFHLLDLYFNLANVSDSILTYDLQNLTWNAIPNSNYANPEPIFIDNTNPDILILQDAFTSGDGSVKYSQNVNVNFTADTHSPMSLSGAKIARYITEDNTTTYTLNVDCNGKALNLGGSGAWLTLNSINTLIQGNKLYVKSDKLTTLTGNSGLCNKWVIDMPALKTVQLTSSQYSDVLTFDGTNNSWPNLTSININNSKLGLNLDNVGVKTINASDVGPASELTLVNCNNISTLNLNNSIFNKITIYAIQPVTFFSKYKYEKNNDGVWKVTSVLANSPKCKYLTLKRTNKDGVVFISDLTYENNGVDEGLTELTLSGYKEIYILDCPYLSKIDIEDPGTVEVIHVVNCGYLSTSLSIKSENKLNTIDLSTFSNLTEVNFKESKKFYDVILPERTQGNGVQLTANAFSFTDLKYLSGTNIKLNKSVFNNSSFTLLQTDKFTLCSFDITQSITDLSSLFHYCDISLDTFTKFNNTYKTLLNKVTVVDSMWSYTPAVKYNEEMLLEDYKLNKSRFDLSMYTNVTSAKRMLGGPNTSACHPLTLQSFAENSTSVNMENFYGWDINPNQIVTIPINWLEQVKTKVNNCNTSEVVIYKVVEYNATDKNIQQKLEFLPKVLFAGNSNNKLTTLKNWVFEESHIINFEESFLISSFPVLTTINKSFVGCKGKNILYNQTINDVTEICGFLYQNTKINNISGSFGFTNYNEITINLDTYLDWASLQSKSVLYKGFLYEVNWDEKYHVLEFNKTISSVNIFNLIYSCLMLIYSAASLSHVFQNCVITSSLINESIICGGVNTNITQIPYLFNNLSLSNGEYLNWDWNIIDSIKNVVDFRYAFKGTCFKGSLPFNFFKRRIAQSAVNVYVKNGEEFKIVLLYKYNYNNNITNLSHTFENCKFEIPTYISTEDDIVNKKARLQDGDTILNITEYYNGNTAFSTKQIIENPEFDDMHEEVTFANELNESYNLVRREVDFESDVYYNFDLEYTQGDVNCSILPTDFLYGCSNTVNLTSCFANTNLQGYIPDHLLNNCKDATLKNFLLNTLVFPKKYDSRYNKNLDELFHIYYYIGSNFCTNTNLDNAFNFRIHLPGNKAENETELHVFCFTDSFSVNLSSIKDGFPNNIQSPPEGCFFAILHLDHSIYMNLMYDKSGETTTSYLQDENGNDITIDELGNPIELKPIIGNLGFKLSLYKNLKSDKLVNELYSLFIYDNVFDIYTTLNSIKKSSDWVIKLGGNSGNTFGVSKYAIWPSAKSVNQKIIYVGYNTYDIIDGIWNKCDGRGVKMYTKNIMGYNDNTKNYYNGSKMSTNAWSINFIDNE